MPCYDSRSDEINYAYQQYAKGFDSFLAYQRHSSSLAQMLCSLCDLIDDVHQMDATPIEVQEWWKEHVKRDIELGKRYKNGRKK